MQISQVKIGNAYAVEHDGKERALRVTEITTVRNSEKVTNYVSGWYDNYDPDAAVKRVQIKVPVSELIMEFEKHSALVAERKRANDAEAAKKKARDDKQWLAVTLLAAAINAQAVKDRYKPYGATNWKKWDEKDAAVIVQYNGIEINEYAIQNIIEALGEQELDGMGNPLDGGPLETGE